MKSDRAAMGASPGAAAARDHRLVGRASRICGGREVRGGRKRSFARRCGRACPQACRRTEAQLRHPAHELDEGALGSAVEAAVEGLPARWFDRAALRAPLAEHRTGRVDHAHLLWSLLVLERWRLRHGVEEVAA